MFSTKDRERCAQLYDRYYSGVKFHDAFYREFIHKYLPREDGSWMLVAAGT